MRRRRLLDLESIGFEQQSVLVPLLYLGHNIYILLLVHTYIKCSGRARSDG